MPSDDTERTATREEIKEWEEEHDEPHPVFDVPHRPERQSLEDENTPNRRQIDAMLYPF